MKEIKITIDGKKYDVMVGDVTTSPIEVVVDGKSYQVEYEAPASAVKIQTPAAVVSTPMVVSTPIVSAASVVAAGNGKSVTAPMPGTIVAVDVKAGDKVARGQQLVSLEAMKMKNAIRAPMDAVVKAVHVTDGQKVQYNDPLVSFE